MPVVAAKKTTRKKTLTKKVVTKKVAAKVSRPRKKNNPAMPPKDEVMPGWIALDDAAEKIGHVSVLFLEKAIHQGKLKAFKNGSMWFTTSEWIGEYKHHIKNKIEEEIVAYNEDTSGGPQWIRTATKKKSLRKTKVPSSFALAGILLAACMSATVMFIMAFPEKILDGVLSFDMALQNDTVESLFLSQTQNFYNAPLVVESYFVDIYVRVFDAASENILAAQSRMDGKILAAGSWMAYAAQGKINDEQLTAVAHEKVQKIAGSLLGERSGQVAGATDGIDMASVSEDVSTTSPAYIQWIKNTFINLKKSFNF